MTSVDVQDPFEVVGAFVDGERVDPEALKSVLATPDGRQYLVDAVTLRELASERPPASVASAWHDRPSLSPARWLAVAAALIVGAASGYLAGHASGRTPATGAPTMVASAPAAPEPTVVIKLQPGDWKEVPAVER